MISPGLSSDPEVKRGSGMGQGRRRAGTWRWQPGEVRNPPLQPQQHQQLPPAPRRGDAPGRRNSVSVSRALCSGGHGPGWGSSPRHAIVKLLGRLVVDGYGHAGVRVEGELHVVVHLGFADLFPRRLHLLRAPGEHRGVGRRAPLGEGSGCPRIVPPTAKMAHPARGSPRHRWPQKGLPTPSGETEARQEGPPCPRSGQQTGMHRRQISAIILNLPAQLQSPASLQQSLWKVGEEEKAKHFKGSTKLL